MSEPVFELRKQYKTTAAADAALLRVVARLRGSRAIRWKGHRPTQEAIINALWLWLDDLPPGDVEAAVAAYVPRLEAVMAAGAESSSPGVVPGQRAPIPPTGPARRHRSG